MKRFWYIIKNSLFSIGSIILLAIVAINKAISEESVKWYESLIFYLLTTAIILQILDVIFKSIKKFKDEDYLKKLEKISEKDREEAQKHQEENKKFQEEYIKQKKNSEILLNKLIQESLIKESEILSVTKSLKYYQVVIYSYPYGKILSSEQKKSLTKRQSKKLEGLRRIYPDFLADLGFIRVGTRSSTTFIINKQYLEKTLRKISEFKKYLLIHFDKVRVEEWNEFLNCLHSFRGKALYNEIKDSFDEDILPINFLLTESIMSAGNMGFLNDKNIGLGRNTNEFMIQLLAGTKIKELKLLKTQKIKIKEFFKKTDVEFLLDGVEIKTKNKIVKNEDAIKNSFDVEYILDFEKVNVRDLQSEFTSLKIDKDIAKLIVERATQFKKALGHLNIQLS